MKRQNRLLIMYLVCLIVLLVGVACSPKMVPTPIDSNAETSITDKGEKTTENDVSGTETSDVTEVSDSANNDTATENEETYMPQQVSKLFKEDTAVAYQIFPIAFADADGNGNGDLQGIISKLDYLKNELNVDVIWLNPIHPSPSYHKYDVTDYYGVDLTFGTMDDYKTLIQEAHKRNIKVLLDFVINHTSSSHPWFISAKSDVNSPYRNYYIWNTLKEDSFNSTKSWYSVSGTDEKYFASFWSEMPELNFENPEVRSEIKKIAKFWLDMDVDGFRIDAAKHIYDINEYPKGTKVLEKNLGWFLEFNQYIKEQKSESFLLLENWDNYNSLAPFLESADSTFNFDLGISIISAVNSENRKNIQDKLPKILNAYDKITTEYVDSVFLANHDQDRTLNQVGGNLEKAKLAAAIEFTLPGISWIYYGEEIGMLGAKPDENIREAMKWTMDQSQSPNSRWHSWILNKNTSSVDVQETDNNSIFSTYKSLTTLKSMDNVIRHGLYIDYTIGTSFRLFSFFRQYEGITYFVVHNLHSENKTIRLSTDQVDTVFSTKDASVTGDTLTLTPYSTLVVKVPNMDITAEEIK